MTTKTSPTDLKTLPEMPHTGSPGHHETASPGGKKPKKRGFIWAIFLVIIIGVGAYAVYTAGKTQGNGQNAGKNGGKNGGGNGGGGRNAFGPQPVVVSPVKRAPVPVYLNGLGNVAAFYTVLVKSRVDGQLMKVNFQEGDLVQKDQVLIEIDPRPYQVQLELAEGTLARDQALLDNAKLDLERYRTLLVQDAVPKQQLDTQVALVAQYEGNIKQDVANIDNAKLQLIYSKVVAPIGGRVGLRLVDPGNIVHAADANGMLLITQLDPITVLFTIPEDSLPQVIQKLRAGAKLQVDAFSRDNSVKIASGVLQTLDNQIDNTTGTSKLKAVFDNKDDKLFPNQFVNIRLLVDTLQNQVVVPAVAVQTGQQGTFVYLVDQDSKVRVRPVQVRLQDQETADIASGVKDGDQVAVDGMDRLQDGLQVRVRKPGELEQINAQLDADVARQGNRRGKNANKNVNDGKDGNPAGAQNASPAAQGNAPAGGNSKGGGDFKKGGDFNKKNGGGRPQ
jgi:multidrug efflux system membrane fusion protein